MLCGHTGVYKQYDSVYIFPKQNHLVLRPFPKYLSEADVAFVELTLDSLEKMLCNGGDSLEKV